MPGEFLGTPVDSLRCPDSSGDPAPGDVISASLNIPRNAANGGRPPGLILASSGVTTISGVPYKRSVGRSRTRGLVSAPCEVDILLPPSVIRLNNAPVARGGGCKRRRGSCNFSTSMCPGPCNPRSGLPPRLRLRGMGRPGGCEVP